MVKTFNDCINGLTMSIELKIGKREEKIQL